MPARLYGLFSPYGACPLDYTGFFSIHGAFLLGYTGFFSIYSAFLLSYTGSFRIRGACPLGSRGFLRIHGACPPRSTEVQGGAELLHSSITQRWWYPQQQNYSRGWYAGSMPATCPKSPFLGAPAGRAGWWQVPGWRKRSGLGSCRMREAGSPLHVQLGWETCEQHFFLEIRPGQVTSGAGGRLDCGHHCDNRARALRGREVFPLTPCASLSQWGSPQPIN